MTIHFENATGERRKALVAAIAGMMGKKAEYKGMPTCDYVIDGGTLGTITVHRDSSMELDDFIHPKEVGMLLHGLRARDFISTNGEGDVFMDAADEEPGDVAEGGQTNEADRPGSEDASTEAAAAESLLACCAKHLPDGITLSFPKNDMSASVVTNLRKLVAGKGWLIKMALETDELPIEETEDAISFPWLKGTAPSELVNACALLIAAMIRLAKKLKHITLTENRTDNPRYAFRCFLLRLGFIGAEYKAARKLLMKGIPGNGSKRHVEYVAGGDGETPDESAS